ncbi:TIR domain-containing adapter molecule 1-like [Myxocyprinus asiaticus]|uniref:TIR domain-containing adapter molecule 1-like n=1 Tax=Myxocyprinus asiaticus TaxID=70543 RepID=UPI0022218205|nr:TIR domain-containing adapter molecule 1-like [Myxocyprinus asiaticus]
MLKTMAEGGIQLMEHGLIEPGLARVFEVLSQAAQERLVSLTFKMGRSRDQELVHAMCLILLKRNEEANAKLKANRESRVAKHLAEMVETHGEGLNSSHFGGFSISGSDTETLLDIARMFAVLVQERLCDKSLRDRAYCTAYVMSKNASLRSVDVDNVFEEVRQVCGPEVIDEFQRSNTERTSKMDCLTSIDISEGNISDPSSLRSSSICSSHSLEISSPTIVGPECNTEESKPMALHTPQESETTNNRGQTLHCPNRSSNSCAINPPQTLETQDINGAPKPCLDQIGNSQIVTSKNTNPEIGLTFSSGPINDTKLRAQPVNSNQCANDRKPPTQANSFRPQEPSSSEENETFYAFVILHESEDADEALRLKDKLESITSGLGATFSEDFAEPGRSSLCCMEDAINNSAFTILLLTKNFNTNLSATSTDSAIINSLEKHHKLHSVIPLLPRENRLPRQSIPLVLRTKVFLDEGNRAFERLALRAMAPQKVANQKLVWMKEQHIKKTIEEQRRLREENSRNVELRRETARLARMRLESVMQQNNAIYPGFQPQRPPPCHGPVPMQMPPQHPTWHQQPSCIHIENAQNVMIGDNSTMNIDHSEFSSEDEDV